jgi:hypothetical protein
MNLITLNALERRRHGLARSRAVLSYLWMMRGSRSGGGKVGFGVRWRVVARVPLAGWRATKASVEGKHQRAT